MQGKFSLVAKIAVALLGIVTVGFAAVTCFASTATGFQESNQGAKLLEDEEAVPTYDPTDIITPTEKPSGLEDSVIAAIVVGCVVVVAILCVVGYSFVNKRRMKAETGRRGSINERVDEEAVAV